MTSSCRNHLGRTGLSLPGDHLLEVFLHVFAEHFHLDGGDDPPNLQPIMAAKLCVSYRMSRNRLLREFRSLNIELARIEAAIELRPLSNRSRRWSAIRGNGNRSVTETATTIQWFPEQTKASCPDLAWSGEGDSCRRS